MKLTAIAAAIHALYGTRRPRVGMSVRAYLHRV